MLNRQDPGNRQRKTIQRSKRLKSNEGSRLGNWRIKRNFPFFLLSLQSPMGKKKLDPSTAELCSSVRGPMIIDDLRSEASWSRCHTPTPKKVTCLHLVPAAVSPEQTTRDQHKAKSRAGNGIIFVEFAHHFPDPLTLI